jgi:cytochrome c oxidase assembly factor CtaG
MVLDVVLEHLGKLHPIEHALVYLLAFGPFLLLGATIWVSRRREARTGDAAERDAGAPRTEAGR